MAGEEPGPSDLLKIVWWTCKDFAFEIRQDIDKCCSCRKADLSST